MVVSAGYDRPLRAWDCRSHSTEPIHVTLWEAWMRLLELSKFVLVGKLCCSDIISKLNLCLAFRDFLVFRRDSS